MLGDNEKYFKALDDNGLTEKFWELCEKFFGYKFEKPNIDDLSACMILTYQKLIRYKKEDDCRVSFTINPYRPENGLMPPYVAGRDDDTEMMRRMFKALKLGVSARNWILRCPSYRDLSGVWTNTGNGARNEGKHKE